MRTLRIQACTALVLCASALTLPGTADATERTESKTYYASAIVTFAPNCALSGNVDTGEPNPDTGIGGVCFPVVGGETSASFRVNDAAGLPVGGEAFFLDASGAFREPLILFCDRGTIDIPEDVATLVVQTDVLGAIPCFPRPSIGGTTGTITATFS